MATYEIIPTPTECWAGTPVTLDVKRDGADVQPGAGFTWTLTTPSGDELDAARYIVENTSTKEWELQTAEFEESGGHVVSLYEAATPESPVASASISVKIDRSQRDATERIAVALEDVSENGLRVRSEKRAETDDQALWVAIRACTEKRSFAQYEEFLETALCDRTKSYSGVDLSLESCLYRRGMKGFALLDAATEVFLLCNACCADLGSVVRNMDFNEAQEAERLDREGVTRELVEQALSRYMSPTRLPYLEKIIDNLNLGDYTADKYPFCETSIRDAPCMFELIWSYWHEMGSLVQTMAAISGRFQNRRVDLNGRDALANLTIDPLRRLNNLMWGYIQEANDWLTVRRRAYEYSAEYGLTLQGRAVGDLLPADPRSRFLESLHALLHECAQFYKDDANQWIEPDPFPLLNAVVAVHLHLADGANNQFGDLPFTARKEMMVQQWLLAQDPMREFLQSRPMTPYDEGWMGQVDAMKRIMGWPDASIIHFNRLAIFGERILLSIRYGNWNAVETTPTQAANWAIYWRTEIQGYIHAYKTVTGVDLAGTSVSREPVDATPPSELIARRMGNGAGAGSNGAIASRARSTIAASNRGVL